jgi:hypothetical protein
VAALAIRAVSAIVHVCVRARRALWWLAESFTWARRVL